MASNVRMKRKPKRLKGAWSLPVPPCLPESEMGEKDWPNFSGRLCSASVVVEDAESMRVLYSFGCFGKGSLSRGHPGSIGEERWLYQRQCHVLSLNVRRAEAERLARKWFVRRQLDRRWQDEREEFSSAFIEPSVTELNELVRYIDPALERLECQERERARVGMSPEMPIVQAEEERGTVDVDLSQYEYALDDDWDVPVVNQQERPEGEQKRGGDVMEETTAKDSIQTVSTVVFGEQADAVSGCACQPVSAGCQESSLSIEVGAVDNHSARDADLTNCDNCGDGNGNAPAADIMDMPKLSPDSDQHAARTVGSPEGVAADREQHGGTRDEISPHLSPFREHIVLTLEEAFFLAFALACLQVEGSSGRVLSLDQLWEHSCKVIPNFASHYVAYHHFRAKGWVCKCGLKFGVDYLLYRIGPEHFHSEFGAVVFPVSTGADGASSSAVSSCGTPSWPLSWHEMLRLGRVGEAVAKTIIICFVLRPSSAPDEDASCLRHLRHFSVEEVTLARWLPGKARIM